MFEVSSRQANGKYFDERNPPVVHSKRLRVGRCGVWSRYVYYISYLVTSMRRNVKRPILGRDIY